MNDNNQFENNDAVEIQPQLSQSSLMNENPNPAKNKKYLYIIYGFFIASLLLGFIPNAVTAFLSMLLIALSFAMAIYIKFLGDRDTVLQSHMKSFIKMMLIFSSLFFVFTVIAIVYMVPQLDTTLLTSCLNNFTQTITDIENTSTNELTLIMEPCMSGFLETNKPLFIISAVIAATIPTLYAVLYLFKIIPRAKNYQIAK